MKAVETSTVNQAVGVVVACAKAAKQAASALANAPDAVVDAALMAMAERMVSAGSQVLAANAEDVAAAEAEGMNKGLLDRLRLDGTRLRDMAAQVRTLAQMPHPPRSVVLNDVPNGFQLLERRRPVGVIGANFEARANVTPDIASQLIKSRNAGVLRTGSAALRSALALREEVIAAALTDAGLPPAAIQLIPMAARETAVDLVRLPELIPLVIIRGSGETTRMLSQEAARHGVRTLAHADGGGVLYINASANLDVAYGLMERSLDRLGVCNRLNLLLIDESIYPQVLPDVIKVLAKLSVEASLPPHAHARGYEWALDATREATVTVDCVTSPLDAARIANEETSGLAAAIVTEDQTAAEEFMAAYNGTGVFWNAPTRLLDGFTLLSAPETGINIDHVPGPRGPVTFRDLYLRQYAVIPK